MYSQANEYLDKGDLENTIDLFNKMLIIKDNTMIRDRLEEIKIEQQAVETTKQLFIEFKRIGDNIDSSFSSDDIMEQIKPIEEVIDSFDKLDTSKETEISQFVKKFEGNPEFQLFKNDYVSGKTIKSGLYEDSLILSTKKLRVKIVVNDLLKTELPSKYSFKINNSTSLTGRFLHVNRYYRQCCSEWSEGTKQ